ncbi:MAG: hypothetical protein R6U96_05490 [Promethearchaeia archaeon]
MNHKLETLLKNNSSTSMDTGRILPHTSQMRDYAKAFPMEETNQTLLDISEEILPLLLERELIPKKLKIAFDFHKKLYLNFLRNTALRYAHQLTLSGLVGIPVL